MESLVFSSLSTVQTLPFSMGLGLFFSEIQIYMKTLIKLVFDLYQTRKSLVHFSTLISLAHEQHITVMTGMAELMMIPQWYLQLFA